MHKSAIADLCVRDASLCDAPHLEAEFLPAESFATRMAHRTAALFITMENNAGFAAQRSAIAFECISRMAHGVSVWVKNESPDERVALRAQISVYHFAG